MEEHIQVLRQLHEALIRGEFELFGRAFDVDGLYEHKDFSSRGGEPVYQSHVAAAYVPALAAEWLGGTYNRQMAGWMATSNPDACRNVTRAAMCIVASWGYKAYREGRRAAIERRVTSRVWLNDEGLIVRMQTERIV